MEVVISFNDINLNSFLFTNNYSFSPKQRSPASPNPGTI